MSRLVCQRGLPFRATRVARRSYPSPSTVPVRGLVLRAVKVPAAVTTSLSLWLLMVDRVSRERGPSRVLADRAAGDDRSRRRCAGAAVDYSTRVEPFASSPSSRRRLVASSASPRRRLVARRLVAVRLVIPSVSQKRSANPSGSLAVRDAPGAWRSAPAAGCPWHHRLPGDVPGGRGRSQDHALDRAVSRAVACRRARVSPGDSWRRRADACVPRLSEARTRGRSTSLLRRRPCEAVWGRRYGMPVPHAGRSSSGSVRRSAGTISGSTLLILLLLGLEEPPGSAHRP